MGVRDPKRAPKEPTWPQNGKNAPNTEKNCLFSALRNPSGTLTSQLFPSSVAGDVQMVNRGFGPLGAL